MDYRISDQFDLNHNVNFIKYLNRNHSIGEIENNNMGKYFIYSNVFIKFVFSFWLLYLNWLFNFFKNKYR